MLNAFCHTAWYRRIIRTFYFSNRMGQGLTAAGCGLLCGSLLREREAVLTHNSLIPGLKVMVRRLPHACMAAVVNPYDDHGTRVRRPPHPCRKPAKNIFRFRYGLNLT